MSEGISYVYRWLNKTNGKSYIGKGVGYRARHHLSIYKTSDHSPKFYRALRKYGEDAFVLSYLALGLSDEMALILERAAIQAYDSQNNGYNVLEGGQGPKHTQETKSKIAAAHKGKKLTGKELERVRALQLGRKHTEETKKQIALSGKGKARSPETRQKISSGLRAYVRTAQHEANLLKANRDPARKVRLSDSLSGDRSPSRKLSSKDIPLIRNRLVSGESCSSIGRSFGVSSETIRDIKTNKTWRSV